jgi:hypothetical protein
VDADQFALLAARLQGHLTRRVGLGALAALSTGAVLAPVPVSGKRKKKKKTCPTTPPPAFCAGKNYCAVNGDVPCSSDGFCKCRIRADTSAPVCGVYSAGVSDCASCAPGTICTVNGGYCGAGFDCVTPCPNPL